MERLLKHIKLGEITTDNNVFLAPMAGGSELAFRRICRRMGAGLLCTELVTAKGIRYKKSIEGNYRYLEISPDEFPVEIQLFGNEPEDFKIAIECIFENPLLSKCAAIDINMGCPVPKVVKTGAGSALMGDLPRSSEIIKAAVKVSPVPVTVKFRSGLDAARINAADFALMCEESGAAMITVHARTAAAMYTGRADWSVIAGAKARVAIPVIGNGDVIDTYSARKMIDQTGADGVMIGRAALGNPWLFREVIAGLGSISEYENYTNIPDMSERIEIIKEHIDGSIIHMGEITAMKEMRKHFSWYFKGVKHAAAIRSELVRCSTRDEAIQILDSIAIV